ncbi:MAG: hypothetical protein KDA22_01890 [Phycisphaerales bacterium]|nr:hypothetical protein [Phycisphaerales bacterium]
MQDRRNKLDVGATGRDEPPTLDPGLGHLERPELATALPPQGGLLLLNAGIATTAVALAINTFALFVFGQDILGWYAPPVPAGAIALGAAAGVGYWGVALWRGVRPGLGLQIGVVIVAAVALLTANVIEWIVAQPVWDDGTPMGFFAFYDITTRGMSFSTSSHAPPKTVGAWGYALRAVELAGFSLGSIVPLRMLCRRSYCESCGRYLKHRTIGRARFGPKGGRPLRRAARAAYDAEMESAVGAAEEKMSSLVEEIDSGRTAEAIAALESPMFSMRLERGSRQALVLNVGVEWCTGCGAGHVGGQLVVVKDPNRALAEFAAPVTKAMAQELLRTSKR